MNSARRNLACAIAFPLVIACSRTPPATAPFTIDRTWPRLGAEAAPLLLNDAVTVYFSAPIQPLTVTSDSVALVDADNNRVPGALQMGSNWVTFQPQPPVSATLDDGSFRPGASYRLLLAGMPRPDAIRATDGRRLSNSIALDLQVAGLDQAPNGLPLPLRPPGVDLPFLLADVPLQLPASSPRAQLHFTLPVLPTSVTPGAFEVLLLREGDLQPLAVRSVRLLTSRLDEFPGSTIELDLGARARTSDGRGEVELRSGDYISISLRQGATALRDLAGTTVLPAQEFLGVVAGSEVALAEWPNDGDAFSAEDGMVPGFEALHGLLRPRVRTEAGDGSLGVFRPRADLVLQPGVPFDRGDGTLVVSRGTTFPFLAIDVPAGVHVVLDAGTATMQLLAVGGVRIRGRVTVRGPTATLPAVRGQSLPVAALIDQTPVSIVAAGSIAVSGPIVTEQPAAADRTHLLLASAGGIELAAAVPFQTLLALEESAGGTERGRLRGPRGQSIVLPTTFTYGLAAGAELTVRGLTPWRQLPADCEGGVVSLEGAAPELQVAWQFAPPDPVRRDQPDLAVGRAGRWNVAADRSLVAVAPGSFVRFEFSAKVRSGRPLPRLDQLRLLAR